MATGKNPRSLLIDSSSVGPGRSNLLVKHGQTVLEGPLASLTIKPTLLGQLCPARRCAWVEQ
jgi:hypothetical protein